MHSNIFETRCSVYGQVTNEMGEVVCGLRKPVLEFGSTSLEAFRLDAALSPFVSPRPSPHH
eukprot:1108963-Pleurochrysis_carterae.AAC.3